MIYTTYWLQVTQVYNQCHSKNNNMPANTGRIFVAGFSKNSRWNFYHSFVGCQCKEMGLSNFINKICQLYWVLRKSKCLQKIEVAWNSHAYVYQKSENQTV